MCVLGSEGAHLKRPRLDRQRGARGGDVEIAREIHRKPPESMLTEMDAAHADAQRDVRSAQQEVPLGPRSSVIVEFSSLPWLIKAELGKNYGGYASGR